MSRRFLLATLLLATALSGAARAARGDRRDDLAGTRDAMAYMAPALGAAALVPALGVFVKDLLAERAVTKSLDELFEEAFAGEGFLVGSAPSAPGAGPLEGFRAEDFALLDL